MGISTVLAFGAGALAIGQSLPYFRAMLRGETKPSRVACAISLACNVLLIVSLVSSGEVGGLLLPAVFALTGGATFVLALKYGISAVTRTDVIAGGIAALAIAAWLVLGTNAAVIGTNIAQVTALMATCSKLRKHPGTENLTSWSMGGVAALLTGIGVLVTASQTGAGISLAEIVMPVRCVLSCLVVLTLCHFQRTAQQPVRTAWHLTVPQVAHLHLASHKGQYATAA